MPKTGISKEAAEVVSAVLELKPGEVRYFEFEDAHKIRHTVRKYLTRNDIGGNIVMSVDKDMHVLHVLRKNPSRVEVLEDLVRRLLVEVDDENLYEKALEVLYGKQTLIV